MNSLTTRLFAVCGIIALLAGIAWFSLQQKSARSRLQNTHDAQAESTPPPPRVAFHWNEVASSTAWEPRDSAASFVFQNEMWTMGGLNGNDTVQENHIVRYWEAPHFNDIWSSTDGAHWKLRAAHAAWSPRRSMSVVLFQDKLWMFGGWSPITGYTSDIWQSTDGVAWTKMLENAPWPAREGQAAEVFRGEMWMMGGVNYDTREEKNDVWHSADGITWHEATNTIPWSPRWDHATAVFGEKMFLTGGMNLSGEVLKDVWATADGVQWELLTDSPLWDARQGHALVSFRDALYLVGRLNDASLGGTNDMWRSVDGITWKTTDTNPPWEGREDHAALVFKNKLYVFGGMSASWQWKNDVWVFGEEEIK